MRARWLLADLALVTTSPNVGAAFSVLAHQGVVDETWDSVLVPRLRARFPSVSERELGEARAFAYGGSHPADLGYFPLGSRMFSDLLRYVRTGDFVNALAASASTPQEWDARRASYLRRSTPARSAIRTSSGKLCAPSRVITRDRWVSTVFVLKPSSKAMTLFASPLTTLSKTARCRAERAAMR